MKSPLAQTTILISLSMTVGGCLGPNPRLAECGESWEVVAKLDRLLVPRLLERCDHNLSHVAQHLQNSRDRPRKRLEELGLYTRR